MIGQTLAHYKILEKIGSGGMGDVYLAEDSKLDRKVALKVLPPDLAENEERRARFQREAKAIAALDHPNIVQVFSVEEDDGTHFITMQLVQGKTLTELLPKNGFPLSKFFDIAIPLADAVAAAHQEGITHRDLKPDNVMVSDDGRVKVLDFGLAKPTSGFVVSSEGPTAAKTAEGTIVGTVAYMSPEQAEAKPVDHRSDIFSMGTILYEMATGQRPFQGDSTASIISSILRETPNSATVINPSIPTLLARIIRRCLAKDPERRFQTAKDLRNELEDLKQDVDSGTLADVGLPPLAAKKGNARLTIAALVTAVLAIAIALWAISRLGTSPVDVVQPTHTQITFTGDATMPAISPDGGFVAYVTGQPEHSQKLIVHDLLGERSLEVFEGSFFQSLRWSPDGAQLLVTELVENIGTYLVPRLGGSPRRLPFHRYVSWSPDGSRFAGASQPGRNIYLTEVPTAEVTAIPISGTFNSVKDLDWSPQDDWLLFLTKDDEGQHTVWVVKTDGSTQLKVAEEPVEVWSPRWGPRGDHIYYLRAKEQTRELWKVPFSGATKGQVSSPSLVLSGLQTGDYSTLTEDGQRMLYTRELSSSNLHVVDVGSQAWSPEQRTTGTLFHSEPKVSPDGKRITFSRGDGQTSNIFVMPLSGGPAEQLTFFDSRNMFPVWSPDGDAVAFASTEGGTAKVWRVDLGGGSARPFRETAVSTGMTLEWSPGKEILYQKPGNRNFGVLDPTTGQERLLIENDGVGWAFGPRYAPDGRRIALHWNQYENDGIWILSPDGHYPITGELGSAGVVEGVSPSFAEGSFPVGWSPDGTWVYAIARATQRIIKIPAAGGEAITVSESWFGPGQTIWSVGTTPDGESFVLEVGETQSDIWLVEDFNPENNK